MTKKTIDPICGMTVDAKHAFQLESQGQKFYFCSDHCLKKFAQEKHLEVDVSSNCCSVPRKKWWKNRTIIVLFSLIFVFILSIFLPALAPFRQAFFLYLRMIWWAILLGLMLGGVIDYFIPREHISYLLAKPRKRTILYSVFLGFLLSACSHGIIALTMELHKKGASTPAAISFLLASPWANLPLTLMFVGFFGLAKALYIIVIAMVIAVITGFIYQVLEKRKIIENNKNTFELAENFSLIVDIRSRMNEYHLSRSQFVKDFQGVYEGTRALGDMILWWILIGMAIASFAGAYIPVHIFQHYMGPTALGMFVTLLVATVMEVCSEGTAPLAFEIFRQTGALGNSFVFLMAGVVTDYTEIGLVWQNIGKKAAIWLPLVTIPQVIFWGIIANWIF